MHEMALAESIQQIVAETAQQQGAVRVVEIRLEIGELANVEREALDFALEVALHGTLAENARLEYWPAPGRGYCRSCQDTVPLAALYDPCPRCGGYSVRPTGGLELRVKDIVVA